MKGVELMRNYRFFLIVAACFSLLMLINMTSYTAAQPSLLRPATNTPIPTLGGPTNTPVPASPISIYGAWHCSNDACIWGAVRDMTDFDHANHWLIDRGDGSGLPSVNLVILSFVEPNKLLTRANDATTANGVPIGMNQAVVNYFTSHNVRVMISIGGITYVKPWDTALAANATQLGLNAAALAQSLGVGIEIDYENARNPNIPGLQTFVDAYRSQLPYDATGANPAARLTIDLAEGDRWLTQIAAKASTDWLKTTNPVLDYANAMVPSRQPSSASAAESNWQEHIDGNSGLGIPPVAPAKIAVSLFLVGNSVLPECNNFSTSLQNSTSSWLRTVVPNGAGTTPGLLGYMFWAAEKEGTRTVTTAPPNTCEGGMGVAAKTFNIPLPIPPLRQS